MIPGSGWVGSPGPAGMRGWLCPCGCTLPMALLTPQMCPHTWLRRRWPAGTFGEILCIHCRCPAVIFLPFPEAGEAGPADGNCEMLQ